MYGYIYMTTNKVTGSLYVGKHKAPKYDPSYLGSGACICKEVGQYHDRDVNAKDNIFACGIKDLQTAGVTIIP